MNISQSIINISEKLRPLLVAVVPAGLLRSIKNNMIEHSLKKRLKANSPESFEPGTYEYGINLIASIHAETGLGQSSRLLADELQHTGIPFTINDFSLGGDPYRAEDHSWDAAITEDTPYEINLLHITPLDLEIAYDLELSATLWKQHYNIGFWLWELEEFPKNWKLSLSLVDEVWTPSEFTSECIRKVTDKPVYTMPYCVTAPTDSQYNREYFHLPAERFLFLMMYDAASILSRKNPLGAIEAFQKAFSPEDERVGLVIKMNNPTEEDLAALTNAFGDYKNIYYITEIMDKIVVNSLIACVDVFVSLHRAEGFGLVMAEAMLNGTPCIATNWSSNTEFMNEDVACMVDYSFVTIKKTIPPFQKGSRWADANTDTAAAYMRKLVEDPTYYEELSVKGKAYIEEKLSMKQVVGKIEDRIHAICGN